MSRLPRNVGGEELAKRLSAFGYRVVRQRGSHMRLERVSEEGMHGLTIPKHKPLRLGTLHSILKDVAEHCKTSVNHVVDTLF
jgi:predicted RNA binding protein YcfA (HicA-like mRNA interferase family)